MLATNKVAAVTGTASAAATLVRKVGVPRVTWGYAVAAGCASAGGALAVALISDSVIRPAIIALLLAVGVFITLKPEFGAEGNRLITRRRALIGLAIAAPAPACSSVWGSRPCSPSRSCSPPRWRR